MWIFSGQNRLFSDRPRELDFRCWMRPRFQRGGVRERATHRNGGDMFGTSEMVVLERRCIQEKGSL